MKKLFFASTVALISLVLLLLLLPHPFAQASVQQSVAPSVQMLHGTFANQDLPQDNTTVTLVSLPFTTNAVGQLQATSLIEVQFGGGNCCGAGGTIVTETCALVLDATTLFTNTWSSNASLPASLSLTTTASGIAAGSHTLFVKCTGSTNTGSPGIEALARSGGTSLAVVSGI